MSFSGKVLRTALVASALSALCVVGASAANLGVASPDQAVRVRESASTDSAILTTVYPGEVVVVLEDNGDGWYKVDRNTVVGYMSADYITVKEKADITIGYGKCTAESGLNIRAAASTDSDRLGALDKDEIVAIVGIDNGWYKIEYGDDKDGYVLSDYIVTTKEVPASRDAATKTSTAKAETKTEAKAETKAAAPASSVGQQIAAYAQKFVGCRYVYGAAGPKTFDCSGFTMYVYKQFGYKLPHGASSSLKYGTKVSKSDLQPGDLVFFRHSGSSYAADHVGIYIGGGKVIHASTNGYKVRIDTINSGYYSGFYSTARRIF